MTDWNPAAIKYSILNPTGNITALVESPIVPEEQPFFASLIMERHPSVEQVGFVTFLENESEQVSLRMAGGEFCGNASMCAAVLYLIRRKMQHFRDDGQELCCRTDHAVPYGMQILSGNETPAVPDGRYETVRLRVSGALQPVEVRVFAGEEGNFIFGGRETSASDCPKITGIFRACVTMPPALRIEHYYFQSGNISEKLPVVFMQGISHVIIEKESAFYSLLDDKNAAQQAVRAWCGQLASDGLGLMFLDEDRSSLSPLVYIPGSDTVFWENSCASGTTAAGIFLANKTGRLTDCSFLEPGGILRAESDPSTGVTRLWGQVTGLAEYGPESAQR